VVEDRLLGERLVNLVPPHHLAGRTGPPLAGRPTASPRDDPHGQTPVARSSYSAA
jgi:hypothetical protein